MKESQLLSYQRKTIKTGIDNPKYAFLYRFILDLGLIISYICFMPKRVERVTKPCVICGTPVTRIPSWMLKEVCCSKPCTKLYLSRKMSKLNIKMNPDRMTDEVKEKLSYSRLGSGEGKAYPKTNSRHSHRVMAEEILGRKLLPGEIVHHIDENKRNYAKDNLQVFASQAEHARHHMNKRLEQKKNPDNWDI